MPRLTKKQLAEKEAATVTVAPVVAPAPVPVPVPAVQPQRVIDVDNFIRVRDSVSPIFFSYARGSPCHCYATSWQVCVAQHCRNLAGHTPHAPLASKKCDLARMVPRQCQATAPITLSAPSSKSPVLSIGLIYTPKPNTPACCPPTREVLDLMH